MGCCALTSACPVQGATGAPGLGLLSKCIPSFRYTETQQPWCVRGEHQPQLTLLPVATRELGTSVVATALASWEDTGGATICSITTVPSLPLSHSQGFGNGRADGAKPQVSTVLGSPFAVKGGRETRSERLEREALQEISLWWILGR